MSKVVALGIGIVAACIGACGGAAPPPAARPAPASSVQAGGTRPINVQPRELEELRIAGSKLITPDDEDKVALGMGPSKIVGSFKLCIDETGRFARVVLLQSTGLPHYDAKIQDAMRHWAYRRT